MQNFKLANIICAGVPQIMSTPSLCCRQDAQLLVDKLTGTMRLLGPGHFDFTTYFNALSVGKWLTYTVAQRFFLHLELRGDACTLTQTHCTTFSWYAEPAPQAKVQEIPLSQEWHTLDIELAVAPGDVFEAFIINTNGEVNIRNAYYYTQVDSANIRNIELAICTTTFKKEEYIKRNISLVREQILQSDERASSHVQMHVIDNGRTLDAESLSGEGVFIHPNPNVGGAGGFARGMIEAMRATTPATHVLLMDDDVTISPESIIRTFNLLSIVNDEYAEAFVSGAMVNFDEPDAFVEDTGFMAYGGMCIAAKESESPMHLTVLHDCVRLEAGEPDTSLRGWEDRAQRYAAWWYCCIPVSTIQREGMPLPLFVRYDDAEYGMRCHPKFMTMTGICVWHLAFKMRFSAAVERYQTARNGLVIQSTTSVAPKSDFFAFIKRSFELDLKKFNYTDAALTLEGLEDFLKGPDVVFEKGFAERRFMEANRASEKLLPLEEVAQQICKEGVDVDLSRVNGTTLDPNVQRSTLEKLQDYLSVNGHRLVPGFTQKGKTAVIEAPGWTYPAYVIRRCDTLVCISLDGTQGIIRHKDEARFKQLWKRYKTDLKQFKSHKDELLAAYAGWRDKVTSMLYWMDYLGIE